MAWTQPKTWSNEPLVAGDLNTHLRDNLEALKDPPQGGTDIDSATDYSTTSGTFNDVDSTDFSSTLTTNGGDVLVTFVAPIVGNSTLGAFFDISVDGVLIGGDDGITRKAVSTTVDTVCLVYWVKGLSAGSHTIKLQWRVTGGTATIYGGQGGSLTDLHGQWDVREVS